MPGDDSTDRPEPDPLWYKDVIVYELHVRSFQDSANDGVGDFKGLTRRLGYLEDLGGNSAVERILHGAPEARVAARMFGPAIGLRPDRGRGSGGSPQGH